MTNESSYATLRAECERLLDWPTEKTTRDQPSALSLLAAGIIDALDAGDIGAVHRLLESLAENH